MSDPTPGAMRAAKLIVTEDWPQLREHAAIVIDRETNLPGLVGALEKIARHGTDLPADGGYTDEHRDGYRAGVADCIHIARPALTIRELLRGVEKLQGGKYYHDLHCNTSREEPMGCPGCSCFMYQRARAAEAALPGLVEALKKIQSLYRSHNTVWHIADVALAVYEKGGE